MKRICSMLFLLAFLGVSAYAEPSEWVTNGEQSFICGDVIQIEAQSNQGFQFDHWSDGETENPRWIEVLESKEYEAFFVASTSTAIDNTDTTTPEVRKVLINDKVYIIRGEHMYDTLGKQLQ